MFQLFTAAKVKGGKIVNLLARMIYTDSVTKDNEVLGQMCQMKGGKDLKKGDRLIIASGFHNQAGVEAIEVNDTDLLPGDTVEDSGILVFELITPLVESSMGAKGWTCNLKLLNIETKNGDDISRKWDLRVDEEVAIFIKDELKKKPGYIFDTVHFFGSYGTSVLPLLPRCIFFFSLL